MDFLERTRLFTKESNPKVCTCKHERLGTGVFYNSVGLIQCVMCNGWQDMRKPIV